MNHLIQNRLRQVAVECVTRETYKFGKKRYQVEVDWPAIEQKVQEITGKKKPLFGGLLPVSRKSSFAPSFANYQEKHNLIVINPVGWRMKLIYATGLHRYYWQGSDEDKKVDALVAMLLAHEARHLKQGIMDYGIIKTPLIMPGTILGPYATLILFALALWGMVAWSVVFWVFAYTLATTLAYWYDWREADARRYAKDHWRDWLPFVKVREF